MTVETGFGLTAQEYYYYGAGAQNLVPVPDIVTRNLIMQSATMQTFITIPETTATGDFDYSFSLNPQGTPDESVIFSRSTEESRTVRVTSTGALGLHVGSTFRTVPAINFRDGLTRRVRVQRIATRLIVSVGGVVVLDNTSASFAGDYSINTFMRRSGTSVGSYASGFLFDVDFVSGFSINATYPLDDTLDTDEVRDTSGNNSNGTASASLGAQFSEPYQVIDVGFLQVANDALITSTPVLGDDSAVEFSLPAITIETGNEYRISATISSLLTTPPGGVNIGWENTLGIPFASPFRLTGSAIVDGATLDGDIVGTGNGTARLFGRDTVQLSYSEISAHRLLRNA